LNGIQTPRHFLEERFVDLHPVDLLEIAKAIVSLVVHLNSRKVSVLHPAVLCKIGDHLLQKWGQLDFLLLHANQRHLTFQLSQICAILGANSSLRERITVETESIKQMLMTDAQSRFGKLF